MSCVIPLLTFFFQSQIWFKNRRCRWRKNMQTPTNETPMQPPKQPPKEPFIQPTMNPPTPQVMHQHNITEQLIQPTMQLIQPTMNPPTPQFMQQHNIMEQLIQPTMNPPTDDDMQQLISLIAQIQ